MISNNTIIMNDLNRLFYLRQDEMMLNLESFYDELLLEREPLQQFWLKYKDKLRKIFYTFYNMSHYESKSLFIKFFSNYIDEKFRESMTLTNDFNDLLNQDSYFFKYFNWLKRYILQFLYGYDLDHFHGICDYETEIEDPERRIIKIKIDLPIDDFDFILDLLENFIRKQEMLLIHKFPSLLPNFKRTYFIFRSF